MNSAELPETSDSSDEDYVPNQNEENVSEVESDGDPEDDPSIEEGGKGKSRKRTKQRKKSRKKQKILEEELEIKNDSSNMVSDEEKKKKEEDLWADFMKDTGFKSKKEILNNSSVSSKSEQPSTNSSRNDKPKENSVKEVTEIFEFAGEQVVVKKQIRDETSNEKSGLASTRSKKSSGGGISGILSQLGKKQKISTLEKSKLDWDQFKKEENLEEELKTFNKGKDGYLERQDFLQRADLRRFEIEKEVRTIERNKRMNNL